MIAGLYFEEHGPAGAPPLILSSGLGGSATYWAANLAALAEKHRVILYDHRGTGRSDRTLPPNLTVQDLAKDALDLINGLGIGSATFIGHALGGLIGLTLALRAPNLVNSLVVINGWSAPDPHLLRCFDTRLSLLRDSGVRAFIRAQPIFLHPAAWISQNDARLKADETHQMESFQGEENVEARIAAIRAFDISDRLGRIHAPALLIAAEDDMLVPAFCSERLAAGLANATLARMTGGHACNVTEPDRFNHILGAWLAGAPNQGAS